MAWRHQHISRTHASPASGCPRTPPLPPIVADSAAHACTSCASAASAMPPARSRPCSSAARPCFCASSAAPALHSARNPLRRRRASLHTQEHSGRRARRGFWAQAGRQTQQCTRQREPDSSQQPGPWPAVTRPHLSSSSRCACSTSRASSAACAGRSHGGFRWMGSKMLAGSPGRSRVHKQLARPSAMSSRASAAAIPPGPPAPGRPGRPCGTGPPAAWLSLRPRRRRRPPHPPRPRGAAPRCAPARPAARPGCQPGA